MRGPRSRAPEVSVRVSQRAVPGMPRRRGGHPVVCGVVVVRRGCVGDARGFKAPVRCLGGALPSQSMNPEMAVIRDRGCTGLSDSSRRGHCHLAREGNFEHDTHLVDGSKPPPGFRWSERWWFALLRSAPSAAVGLVFGQPSNYQHILPVPGYAIQQAARLFYWTVTRWCDRRSSRPGWSCGLSH